MDEEMLNKEKPLPKPSSTPFRKKKHFENLKDDTQLLANRMAISIAEDNLDEFMEKELPEGNYAKALSLIMMGISGIIPIAHAPATTPKNLQENKLEDYSKMQVPEEVVSAVQSGDVKGLMEMLKKESEKRDGFVLEKTSTEEKPKEKSIPSSESLFVQEKDVLDNLLKIASDNNLDVNWLILRVIKIYVEEYERTGRL